MSIQIAYTAEDMRAARQDGIKDCIEALQAVPLQTGGYNVKVADLNALRALLEES